MKNKYDEAVKFLYETLRGKNVQEIEKRYRFEHSLRVANIAKEIAEAENQDVLVVTMAAILHDVGKFDTDIKEEHGRVSANLALPFLKTLGVSKKQVGDIMYCIAAHVDGEAGYDYDHIAEAKTVMDADAIERFGIYRIYQSLIWGEIEQIEEAEITPKCNSGRLKNFKTILSTNAANVISKKNLDIQINYYKHLK